MSEKILYEVEATFQDAALADEWLHWMLHEHIADVIRAGALNGRVIKLDGDRIQLLAQYEFQSRSSLDSYLEHHAPRLRAMGLARFGPDNVTYARRTGLIIE